MGLVLDGPKVRGVQHGLVVLADQAVPLTLWQPGDGVPRCLHPYGEASQSQLCHHPAVEEGERLVDVGWGHLEILKQYKSS